ncbi:ANTAR domain-containing response regulator [Clostridium tyrobutyricum]|uniref:ANTAR domain-containing response regulator n=1 Tax=Clostridium tyrobutyricum TaxID=1519 RepID=UPI00057CBE15|nr:response regulator [Clostridium tyrobutyricum]MBV4426633.1 response regulator [Clostridium tyrobutyricum]MBV4431002.1 response regulator [Clostridium tyrobutyricum]MBV4439916.1 response regulator [Clostridium tyrobutyricum]MBV4439919.1 response regulator [Clostridium tyrobutyricum]MBV4441789.1 response regulator [Clostridium tyrobutyricum]
MKGKIVLAEDEPITRMDISEMLISSGYDVVGKAADGLQAVDLCRIYEPDLAIMDIKMPKLDGIQASKILIDENIVDAVVMLTAYSGSEFIDKVKEVGAIGYIVKPIDERNLIPQIEIAISKGKEIRNIRNEIIEAKDTAKNIKIIHQAKEILMDKYSMKENDAYRQIRKLSMDGQKSILETSIKLIRRYRKADKNA